MASGGKPTAGRAEVRKAKHERKYGSRRQLITEANRRRKRLNHFNRHRNDIKGVEELRKSLGINQ